MKKLIKSLGIILVVALMCCAFAACGGGTKYTFDKTTIEGDSSMTSAMSSFTATYDTLYKDSYIIVGSSEIEWTVGKDTNKMSYTKDGDKYVLSGDYTKNLSDALSGLGAGVEISIWGAETADGYKIVLEETIGEAKVSIVLNFKK